MKDRKVFKHFGAGLKLLFHLYPGAVVWYCFLQLLHGTGWVLQVICMQCFLDRVTAGDYGSGGLITGLLFMGGAFLFAQIMNGVANCYGQILNKKIGKKMNMLVFRSVQEQDAIAFEDPEELDRLHRAQRGSEGLFWVSTTVLDVLFFYAAYFVMMGGYLFSLSPVLSVGIIAVFIPNALARFLHTITFTKLEQEAAPVRRKSEYYEKCLVDKEYWKETRLLGAGSYFKDLYMGAVRSLNRLSFRAQQQKEALNTLISFVTVLAYGSIIGLLIYYVMGGIISIGAFAAVLASLREFYGFMDEVISERFAWAAENAAVVENYLDYIQDSGQKKPRVKLPEQFDVQLEDVCFSYPHREGDGRRLALDHVSVRIPWGQTVALVGENGSGKSTLCSVIAGLYAPTQGTVSYGDVHHLECRIEAGISAVFQKFCKYQLSLEENIRISDWEKPVSQEELTRLCKEVGVEATWTGGFGGMLGKEFGGTELSGGQWQRIAIARGMFRKKRLMILDEPTAAIDALEENHLYSSFRKLCQNCTAILVTHRLASAQIADRILVMKDGQIVQDGPHEELISVEGEYKNMYELQKKRYS